MIKKENDYRLIHEKTPAKYIKRRPGAGGMMLDYVEVGYVIDILNRIFNYRWNFEVEQEVVGKEQIYVRGKLTGYDPQTGTWISKTQYGGSEIKRFVTGLKVGLTMDIANDLKSAASDSLKKCASLFGVAKDVFWKGGEE